MLSIENIRSLVSEQSRLNCIINPNWVIDRTQNDFNCAMLVETAELLEHVGYKWWKKQPEFDMKQAQMEVIDLWFFMISRELLLYSPEAIALEIYEHQPTADVVDQFSASDVMMVSVDFSHDTSHTHLRRLTQALQITPDILYDMYMGKLILNIFRQTHGYSTGTYIKDWNGLEDNQVLHKIMETTQVASEIEFQLEEQYKLIK